MKWRNLQAKVYGRHNQAGNEVLSAALLGPISNKLLLEIKILPGMSAITMTLVNGGNFSLKGL